MSLRLFLPPIMRPTYDLKYWFRNSAAMFAGKQEYLATEWRLPPVERISKPMLLSRAILANISYSH